ncbi:MAG TPA: GAF domain-containing protein [Thermoleophilaceae bacterium]|nr:GAF domain-containing protein [Thermoleophilaceae bacterium]
MPLKAATIRVSPELWTLLEEEAARQEISVSQFVRDAALLRVGYLAGARGDENGLVTIGELASRSDGERRRFSSEERRQKLEDPVRLAAIEKTGLVGVKEDPVLHRLTRLAARSLDAPVALLSFVAADRQFFASSWGLPEPWASDRGTDLLHSFCQHVVVSNRPLLVTDARKHPLVQGNRAIEDLDVIAYVGVPMNDSEGNTLGSFCVIDHEPRQWKAADVELLHDFAVAVMDRVENRT